MMATGHLTEPLEVPMFRDGFKGEYLHSDFGSDTVSTGTYWGTASSSYTVDHKIDVVRIGIDKRF